MDFIRGGKTYFITVSPKAFTEANFTWIGQLESPHQLDLPDIAFKEYLQHWGI